MDTNSQASNLSAASSPAQEPSSQSAMVLRQKTPTRVMPARVTRRVSARLTAGRRKPAPWMATAVSPSPPRGRGRARKPALPLAAGKSWASNADVADGGDMNSNSDSEDEGDVDVSNADESKPSEETPQIASDADNESIPVERDAVAEENGNSSNGGDNGAAFDGTPLSFAAYTNGDSNVDSAGADVDSNPLLAPSQIQHSDDEDGQFLAGSQALSMAPLAGLGTAADLMVLDYLSHQVIGEVVKAGQMLSSEADMADARHARLDCYALEQVLVRKCHFTRQPFLGGDQRPADEDDMTQWALSLQRINLATFLLLVFRPHMVVVGPASSGMPNRRRMVSSIGLEAAAKSFFTYVVPANLRSADTADLLVDLQTQQLLAAANDEEHLQALAVELRDMDDDHVAQLLGIESHDGDGGSKGNGGGSAQQFDLHAAAHYRKEVGRRLNKISGGKLHITRQQYSLHMLWKRVADFGSECSSGWRGPYILGDASSRLGDASFRTADDAEDEAGELSKCADLLDAGAAAVNGSAAPLDASFTHERKVAALLRDAQGDAHLSELLEAIETELIDISDSQALSRTPRQLRPARRLVEARVPSGGDANNSNDGTGAGFRVQADEDYGTESSEDIPHMVKRYARASRASATRASGQHEQAGGSPPHRSGAFRGRRGIAAEDPESLRYDAGERAAFTPSDRGTPEPEDHTRGADTRDAVSAYLSPAARRAKAPGREGAGGRLSPVVYIDNRNTARAYLSPSSRRSTASVWQAAKEHVAAAATARPPGRSAPAQPAKSKRRREASSDEDDEDGYSSTAAPAPARNRHAKPAQHRTRWTPEEEECLVTALLEFGPQWALILRYHGRDGLRSDVLRSRSRPNLKDKARNIKLRLKRDNKPLGPFEAVTG